MNRIETIKTLIESQRWITATEVLEHLEWAMSKLEITEKALEEINGYDRYFTGEDAREMRVIADTALQQIRID